MIRALVATVLTVLITSPVHAGWCFRICAPEWRACVPECVIDEALTIEEQLCVDILNERGIGNVAHLSQTGSGSSTYGSFVGDGWSMWSQNDWIGFGTVPGGTGPTGGWPSLPSIPSVPWTPLVPVTPSPTTRPLVSEPSSAVTWALIILAFFLWRSSESIR